MTTPASDDRIEPRVVHDADVGITMHVDDGVAVIVYDQPGAPVNTLNTRVAPVFDRLFSMIENDASITSAVLFSGKTDSWIAGADIDELANVATAAQGEALSRGGQRLLECRRRTIFTRARQFHSKQHVDS